VQKGKNKREKTAAARGRGRREIVKPEQQQQ